MTPFEWETAQTPWPLLEFAIPRIPRQHLCLVLAEILRTVGHPRERGPATLALSCSVASVREYCLGQADAVDVSLAARDAADVRRYADGLGPRGHELATIAHGVLLLTRVALAPMEPVLPPARWAKDRDPLGLAAKVKELLESAAHAVRLTRPEAASFETWAELVRDLVPFPSTANREWRCHRGFVFSGDTLLRFDGDELGAVVPAEALAKMHREDRLALDLACAAAPEETEDARETRDLLRSLGRDRPRIHPVTGRRWSPPLPGVPAIIDVSPGAGRRLNCQCERVPTPPPRTRAPALPPVAPVVRTSPAPAARPGLAPTVPATQPTAPPPPARTAWDWFLIGLVAVSLSAGVIALVLHWEMEGAWVAFVALCLPMGLQWALMETESRPPGVGDFLKGLGQAAFLFGILMLMLYMGGLKVANALGYEREESITSGLSYVRAELMELEFGEIPARFETNDPDEVREKLLTRQRHLEALTALPDGGLAALVLFSLSPLIAFFTLLLVAADEDRRIARVRKPSLPAAGTS